MKEKSKAEILKDGLFMQRKNVLAQMSEEQVKNADDLCEDYKSFLRKAKTEREFVKEALKLAKEAGFEQFDRTKKYRPNDRIYFNNRNKALILVVVGEQGSKQGLNLAAAHIDSPRLDLKPNPLYEANDLAHFKTHYYGGIKKYQWTAIPLALHGIVVKKDGSSVEIVLGEEEGDLCFCITDLLPHLAKEQMAKSMAKGVGGESLNLLIGSRPFCDEESSELVKLNVMRLLNERYGLIESDFLSAELEVVPAIHPVDIGFDRSMIGAYGQDDKVCAYTALRAILNCQNPFHTVMTILSDKEEVGSDGNTGMNSSFFRYFIEDLVAGEQMKARHVLSQSRCLSADVNAAFDPNYASVYDPLNSCYLNRGVVVTKYTGSGGKYDTSDASAEFMGIIRRLLDKSGIAWQPGELGKVDAGGGGTIAKFMAQFNVNVVDLGVPILSMHAPLEVSAKSDVFWAYRTFEEFFACDFKKL